MKTLLIPLLVAACTPLPPIQIPDLVIGPFPHDALDRVQRRFVDLHGRVDYLALQRDPIDLETYYGLVAAHSPDSHPQLFPDLQSQLAYWINAYNAATLKAVLLHYPISSVAEVDAPTLLFFMPEKSGFFYFLRPVFGGKEWSLYHLEHDLIRPRFKDPRIHFALNCASRGCPRLPRRAFSAHNLDAELDRETRTFLSEARNFRVDFAARAIYLSSLFDWYQEDYIKWLLAQGIEKPTLLDYVYRYLSPAKRNRLDHCTECEVRFVTYDWNLNDQRDTASRSNGSVSGQLQAIAGNVGKYRRGDKNRHNLSLYEPDLITKSSVFYLSPPRAIAQKVAQGLTQ